MQTKPWSSGSSNGISSGPSFSNGGLPMGPDSFAAKISMLDRGESQLYDNHCLLTHAVFRGGISLAILVSTVQMGVQAQIQDAEAAANFEEITSVLEHAVTAMFCCEMFVKIAVMGRDYFCNYWDLIDLVVVTASVADTWVLQHWSNSSAGSLGMLRVCRVLRLLRLLRLLKFLRQIPELMLVLEGLASSLKAAAWVLVLLVVVVYAAGIICTDTIGTVGEGTYPGRLTHAQPLLDFDNHHYFGNLSRSMQTLVNVILIDEWGKIIRPMWGEQPHMALMLLVFVFVVTFGFFNVIVGVVVQKMTDGMEKAKRNGFEERRAHLIRMAEELAELMNDLDHNSDGLLTPNEIGTLAKNKRVNSILNNLGLPHGLTFGQLHEMLDLSGCGAISRVDWIHGMIQLIDGDSFQRACLQQLMLGRIMRKVNEGTKSLENRFSGEISTLKTELSALQWLAATPQFPQADSKHSLCGDALDDLVGEANSQNAASSKGSKARALEITPERAPLSRETVGEVCYEILLRRLESVAQEMAKDPIEQTLAAGNLPLQRGDTMGQTERCGSRLEELPKAWLDDVARELSLEVSDLPKGKDLSAEAAPSQPECPRLLPICGAQSAWDSDEFRPCAVGPERDSAVRYHEDESAARLLEQDALTKLREAADVFEMTMRKAGQHGDP